MPLPVQALPFQVIPCFPIRSEENVVAEAGLSTALRLSPLRPLRSNSFPRKLTHSHQAGPFMTSRPEFTSFEVDRSLIEAHVVELTRVPRPCHSRELEAARSYVTRHLKEYGWEVRRHDFDVLNDVGELNLGENLHGTNLVATRRGYFDPNRPRLCVGAHLDSRPDTPGADDNASAVAAMLELARILPSNWPDGEALEIELVAFDLEENGMLGGREHARLTQESGVDLRGMISLEMLGYCDHAPNSQSLPRTLKGLYPDTGDFIAIVGNQNSTNLIEQFRQGMEQVQELPVETLQVPENGNVLQATRLSDHSPFWDAGYPALMITDTSFMRNPHYHMSTDTCETLDMHFLYLVTEASTLAVRRLLTSRW
jgi:aminopeptidase YwaD